MKTGIYDNRTKQRREAWLDGGKVGDWPAAKCGDSATITAARGWEKQALEKPFGSHPDVEPTA